MLKKQLKKAVRRKMKEIDRGIVDFMQVTNHFFKHLSQWINEMTDPRNESYITYTQSDLISMGILKNVCAVGTMRQMNEKFNEENCIRTLSLLSGNGRLSEMPDYGTLNYYLSRLSPSCLEKLRTKMVRSLIRSKAFNKNRLLGKYWVVILDGTGLFHFKERHCPHCLSRKVTNQDGRQRKEYYHNVLEAKLVLSEKLVISLGTEFIENEKEDVTKQDCELGAAKRLLKTLKEEYPRLGMCVLGDSLYAAETMMKQCRENNWAYIFNMKAGRQKCVTQDYEWLKQAGEIVEKTGILKEGGTGRYSNHMEQVSGKTETFHVFEYEHQRKRGEAKVRFVWAGSIKLTERNLEELIKTGRKRWKIENEGFNNQKNGIYEIEHLNSRNARGMKNHYLLTQIADMLMQLYLESNKLVKELSQSIKNTSSRLLESFRRQFITEEDVFFISKYTTLHLE